MKVMHRAAVFARVAGQIAAELKHGWEGRAGPAANRGRLFPFCCQENGQSHDDD
jgi:hypothetical protein